MTSELRPAIEVWTEAFRTWDREPGYVQAVYEAAAVIEADREAVRAEVVGEIVEWLNKCHANWIAERIEAKFGKNIP